MADHALRTSYESRATDREEICERLAARIEEILLGQPHIDRISFRPKSVSSFMAKAIQLEGGALKYSEPLREIEDQIAGRVLAFFRADLPLISNRISSELGPIEQVHREPEGDTEFWYESEHFICVIPSHLKPESWNDDPNTPQTFELQLRTLFMHAWAEPQHDLGYKPGGEGLTREQRRRLAWVASSAWGADQVLDALAEEMANRRGLTSPPS